MGRSIYCENQKVASLRDKERGKPQGRCCSAAFRATGHHPGIKPGKVCLFPDYSPPASSATRASTSASLILMPFLRSSAAMSLRRSEPFLGVKSSAEAQPTIAPPTKAEIKYNAFISNCL